jgi:hypothetical protein
MKTSDDFDPYKRIDNIRKAIKKYDSTAKGKITKRKSYLKCTYNLSLDEYNKKLQEQSHKCAVCGIDETELTSKLHVDHNHTTGKIRDLLCTNCNTGIGMFKENIDNLAKAISYLEKHKD